MSAEDIGQFRPMRIHGWTKNWRSSESSGLGVERRLRRRLVDIALWSPDSRGQQEDWKFLAGKDMLTYRNNQVPGLGLPDKVVRKIFRENAVRWLPGIVGA